MAQEVVNKRAEIKTTTPMMKQYLEIKDEYSEYILLYRLGDFYECFFDDALIASHELELTLTGRDCGEGKRAAMCGVPFHKADVYIGRLVDKGYKVAICEQTENPKEAQGLVKRAVTRVVTPGTVTDSSALIDGKNNFLCGICFGTENISVAFVDITTGEMSVTYLSGTDAESRLLNELGTYQPSEVIMNITCDNVPMISAFITERLGALITDSVKRLFNYDTAAEAVKSVFDKDEESKLTSPEMIIAVGALIGYIKETQKTEIAYASGINVYSKGQYLEIDLNTKRNLELTESMRNKERRGSLLWVLDKTKTAMGTRLLRSWIIKPLINPLQIAKRQGAVTALLSDLRKRDALCELLSSVLDLERLTARAVYTSANAKDLQAICQSISKLPEIKSLISGFNSGALQEISAELDTLDDLCELLDAAIADNPPYTVREGGMIKPGYDSDVDYYRSIKCGGEEIMKSIEEREKDLTGIRTLKVDYNKVFGYYIEVSKSFINDVPDRYVRKQTLTNCERYITQELKEMENSIFGADEKLVALEFEIFSRLRETVAKNAERIMKSAAMVAELDVYRSFAEVADKNAYVCPEVDLSSELTIKDGRHPIVEKFVTDSYFVPNDTLLDTGANRMMIITGPNMAGKSTYMRQVAIITVMAQIGSFVPARYAKIGIVDKLFTRVGASDDLAAGQSTFMLEMSEVAAILKNATKRSLIIYDEVGRGTSTYDGMAIARAVVEYTASKKIGAKTLFATHYHELTAMENDTEGVVNYNIAAKKRGDSITFLRKIVRGGTDDSYGIEVAKLAGVPSEVTKRAKEILKDIESGAPRAEKVTVREENEFDLFSSLSASRESEAAEKIRGIDLNTLTPIEAMNLLFEVKKMLD